MQTLTDQIAAFCNPFVGAVPDAPVSSATSKSDLPPSRSDRVIRGSQHDGRCSYGCSSLLCSHGRSLRTRRCQHASRSFWRLPSPRTHRS
jgi:hypothetical protein